MKKILYIETSKDGVLGGSFYSLLEIIKGLNKTKYKPYVIFYRPNEMVRDFEDAGSEVFCFKNFVKSSHQTFKKSQYSGLKTIIWKLFETIGFKNNLHVLLNLNKDRYFGYFCAQFAKENGIDLVHINDGITPGLPIIRSMGSTSQMPLIVHERKIRKYSIVDRYYSKRINRIICISKSVQKNYLNYFGNEVKSKVSLIYNPIASDLTVNQLKKDNLKNEFGITHFDVILLQISNLIPWKGQDTVISTIPMIKRKLKELRIILLLVGGDMPNEKAYIEKLKGLVSQYGLQEQVKFCGFRRERAEFLDLADVFIHIPSQPEPFGRVVLEAMQMGKPIITSCEGGPAEIVENGKTGWLIPPNDTAQLCKAVIDIVNNVSKRAEISQMAKRVSENRFSNLTFSRNIEEVYKQAFNKK